ncbi:lyase family protein [Enteractinococcus fodinae]|uniref:3-carboxy-cis,cis-muconate cycloisomerase n=1 Tax=Enteractinococcus fodinae TaxID=684663 RepID=A0ABU2B2C8_9MICC|nr:lyase family protein [Enteractinococcus fodinae]MDR7347736.1 3-carboxy-cis,cis-muconate cycloisomerase [Enteractinococcus fodinae]
MYDYGLLNPVWAGTRAAEQTSDVAFAQAMLDVEAAWCRAQIRFGTAPESIGQAVETACDITSYDLTELAAKTPDGANALIPLLAELRNKVAAQHPEAAGYIHRGATSQDIIDTALMLVAARTGEHIVTDLKTTVGQLGALADQHAETVMIGRSLDQHAQPISFGYRVSQWLEAIATAGQQFETTLTNLPVQWGGAVGTSTWWVDYFKAEQPEHDPMQLVTAQRDMFAEELGLVSASVWHANRMPVTQLAHAAFEVVAAAAKLANDVLTAVQAEHAELAEPNKPGRGGSSAMPHKNNPVLSIRLKNAAQEATGQLTALHTGVISNTAERADGGWHSEWAALRGLLRVTGAVAEILSELTAGLEVFPQAMRRNLDIHGNYLLLGRISQWLAPLVEAHDVVEKGKGKQLVESICQEAIASGDDLAQTLGDRLPDGLVSVKAIEKMLDPSGYMGGAATIVAEVNSRYRKWST